MSGGEGAGREPKGDEQRNWSSVSHGGLTWIDVRDPGPGDVGLLAHEYPFHPLNLEDCLSRRQLTKVEDHTSYVFMLLHFPSLGSNRIVVQNQISVFIGKEYLVTLHGANLAIVGELMVALKADEAMRSLLMKSSAYLAYAIIDKLVDGIYPVLDRIRNYLDDVEDEVFDGRVSSAGSINRIRREVADLRRIVFPLRRTIVDASSIVQKYTEEDLQFYFADVREHSEKAWEIVDETREMIEIYKDSDFILSSEKTNRVLSILTIIFTLSIPATVIASIYGMNVILPGGLSAVPLMFLGPYTSFVVLLVAMTVPACLMLWYFRRLGWL